jgi:hypothetical protein
MHSWFVFARIIDPTVTRVLIAPRFLAHVPIRRGIPEDIGLQLRCNVFLKLFFTEITVGGCKLAGIGGRGGPRNLPQFFPSEIDLGGCKLLRESTSSTCRTFLSFLCTENKLGGCRLTSNRSPCRLFLRSFATENNLGGRMGGGHKHARLAPKYSSDLFSLSIWLVARWFAVTCSVGDPFLRFLSTESKLGGCSSHPPAHSANISTLITCTCRCLKTCLRI